MSEDTTDHENENESDEKVEDRIGKGELLEEVASLTRRLSGAVERAWDSEQRRSVQKRVIEELRTAGDHVDNLTRNAGSSKVGQDLTEGAEKIGRQLGEGLLSGLKALNRELSRTLEEDDDDEKKD